MNIYLRFEALHSVAGVVFSSHARNQQEKHKILFIRIVSLGNHCAEDKTLDKSAVLQGCRKREMLS